MDGVTWYPGSGWGVVGPHAFAWLAPTWAAADVAACHALLAANANPDDVIGLLEPGGLAGRGFALVSIGSRRFLVTMGVPARATGSGEVRELKGARGRADACDLPVGWSAAVGGCEPRPGMPLADGVAQCGGLAWGDISVPSERSGSAPPGHAVREAATVPGQPQPRPTPDPREVSGSNPFADLWGHTMRRPVEAAAVRHVRDHDRPDDDGPADHTPGAGGIEGAAVVRSAPTAPLHPVPEPQEVTPVEPVPPVRAPAQRPQRIGDATLITAIVDEPSDLDDYGRAVSQDGEQVEIRGTVVIGRAPSAMPGEDCQLLRVPSPDRSVSRNHVVLRVVDGLVVGSDLGSNNGTMLIRLGQSPVPLTQDPPRRLRHGDVLDLGLGCTVRLVGLP